MPAQNFMWPWKFTGMYSCAVAELAQNLFFWKFLPLGGMLGYCECCQLGQEDTQPMPKFYLFQCSRPAGWAPHTFSSLIMNLGAL
jgi:hypothetical protein